MKKTEKKSAVRRLFFANVWIFLLLLLTLALVLWGFGLWPSIFAFLF